ncbi:hypothetical protein [Bacillus toyonensis]|nr:hypothetical protein [Bacillus toyonensis]
METNDLLLAIEQYAIEKGLDKSETTVSQLIDLLGNDVLEGNEF